MLYYEMLDGIMLQSRKSCASQLDALAKHLSSSAPDLGDVGWADLVAREGVSVVVCFDDERIVGMGTVIVAQIPSRVKAYIEDVAVDETYRRRGIASAIEESLLGIAREAGAPVAYLTSSRPAAKVCWDKLGWKVGETNAYYKPL